VGTSGSHPADTSGARGLLRADGSGHSEANGPYSEIAPPRSKAWIAVGVLLAAVLGGVLGMAAFRMTANSGTSASTAPTPVSLAGTGAELPTAAGATSAAPAAGATSAAVSAVSAATLADARSVTLKVTSEPAGASVREDATELCAATPCDVTFKGEAADPTKAHKLLLSHAGFRAETRSVKPGDAALHVKLARGGLVPSGRPAAPATTKPAPDTTPNGFKDLPY
jgi:serine/threonine-protein kinase